MSRFQQTIATVRNALTRQNLPSLLDKVLEYGLYVYVFALFRATTWRTIAIVALTSAWLLKLVLTRGAGMEYLRQPVVKIGLLFFGLTLLSVFYSPDVRAAAVEYAHTLGIAALMALIFPYVLRDERVLRRLLWAALFVALYLNFIQIKGIVIEYSRVGAWLQDVNLHRPHSLSLIFYVPFLLALASLFEGPRARWLMAAAALQFVLLVATAGRAAMLSIAVGMIVWFMLHAGSTRMVRRVAVIGVAALAIAVLLLAVLPKNSFVIHWLGKGLYAQDRIEATWTPAVKMIANNPLSGYGYGNFVYPQVFDRQIQADVVPGWPREWVRGLGPHNYYLETWFNSGLLALVAMLWLFGRFFVDTWRVFSVAADPVLRQLGSATLVSFTALYLVHAHFGPLGPSGLRPLGVLLGIGIALLTMQRARKRRAPAKKKR